MQPAERPADQRRIGMWDDELCRPLLSLLVTVVWLVLVWLLGELWPWGFAS